MKIKEIVIGVEKRYANVKIVEKMKKFIKDNKGEKTGKIDIRDIKYAQDESNNYYTFTIDSDLTLDNSSEYVKAIVSNVLKKEKVNPFISSCKEIDPIKESYKLEHFDFDEFVDDLSTELEGSIIDKFSQYSFDVFKASNKSYENVTGEPIYLEITFETDKNKLHMRFDVNNPLEELSRTFEGEFNASDISNQIIDFTIKRLEEMYLSDKESAKYFEQDEIERLIKKYPEDSYLKSLVTINKYKLLDNYNGKIRKLDEFDPDEFAKYISVELYGSLISGFNHYGDRTYILHNDSYENISGDHVYVEVEFKNDKMELDFDINNPHLEPLNHIFEGEYHDLDVAQVLIDFMIDRLEQLYLFNNEFAKSYDTEELERLLEKYPEDNYLRSLIGGNKYKLLDYYSFKESRRSDA